MVEWLRLYLAFILTFIIVAALTYICVHVPVWVAILIIGAVITMVSCKLGK